MSEENREQNELNIPFAKKPEEPVTAAVPETKPKRKHRIPAPAWFGIGCAAVLGALLIGWQVREKILGEQIVLLDNSQPVFGGYSSGGYLAADFAPENTALNQLEQMLNERKSQGKSTDALERLIRSVSCSFEKDGGYSNNENVIYACSYDQAAAEDAGIRFSSAMKTYTVSGLAEYAVLDVFSGVSADWAISNDGLSIAINAPQELLDMGIRYSWSYGGDTYNGDTIFINAEFDQNVLMSYGYIVNNDETERQLGPMPEQIMDISTLSADEKNALIETLRPTLENEIAGCSSRATLQSFTGTYSIEITGIEEATIEPTGMSYFDNSGAFRVTFGISVNADYQLSDYLTFHASYTGRIYRMGDGSIRFLTNTVHACEFTGLFGTYSLRETQN